MATKHAFHGSNSCSIKKADMEAVAGRSLSVPCSLTQKPPVRLLSEQDVASVHQIQSSLLPRALPELPGFEIEAFCKSAGQVGGDCYDVLSLASGSVLFMISDAMGKGLAAAMAAATLRDKLQTLAEWSESPGAILARANRLMYQELADAEMFVTVQLGVLDPTRRLLTLANAGHCPLLLRNGGSEVELLSPEGVPLGILPDAVFVETVIPLNPGASALFYTDGLTDVQNHEGDLFGEERLQKWFLKEGYPRLPAQELKEKLLRQIASFETGRSRGGVGSGVVSAAAFPDVDDRTFILLVSSDGRGGQVASVNADKASPHPVSWLRSPCDTVISAEPDALTPALPKADLPAA